MKLVVDVVKIPCVKRAAKPKKVVFSTTFKIDVCIDSLPVGPDGERILPMRQVSKAAAPRTSFLDVDPEFQETILDFCLSAGLEVDDPIVATMFFPEVVGSDIVVDSIRPIFRGLLVKPPHNFSLKSCKGITYRKVLGSMGLTAFGCPRRLTTTEICGGWELRFKKEKVWSVDLPTLFLMKQENYSVLARCTKKIKVGQRLHIVGTEGLGFVGRNFAYVPQLLVNAVRDKVRGVKTSVKQALDWVGLDSQYWLPTEFPKSARSVSDKVEDFWLTKTIVVKGKEKTVRRRLHPLIYESIKPFRYVRKDLIKVGLLPNASAKEKQVKISLVKTNLRLAALRGASLSSRKKVT
jgi:hypothetical protein